MTPSERMEQIKHNYSDWIDREPLPPNYPRTQLPEDVQWLFERCEKLERMAEVIRCVKNTVDREGLDWRQWNIVVATLAALDESEIK